MMSRLYVGVTGCIIVGLSQARFYHPTATIFSYTIHDTSAYQLIYFNNYLKKYKIFFHLF